MTGETGERLRWAAEVAARVGGLLIERFRHTVAAERKARGIVTDLDREADRLIADALEESFPQDGLLSEEGAFHGGASGWRWIVDPLDGTTNYVSGLPHFGVSLACLDPEGVALGLVHAPAFGETFSAVRGEGSQGPDGPLRPTGTSDLSDAVFLLNKAYHPAAELWERSERLLERIRAHRMLGCVSLDLAFVAAGRGDGIILLEAEPWDIAAGVLLMAEAGIRVANLDGGPPPAGPADRNIRRQPHNLRAGPPAARPLLVQRGPDLLSAGIRHRDLRLERSIIEGGWRELEAGYGSRSPRTIPWSLRP